MKHATRKRIGFVFPLLFVLTAVSACTSLRSGSDQDEFARFDNYRTFSWIDSDPLVTVDPNDRPISPLTQQKITNAILGALERQGFLFQEDRETADFVVAYTVGTRDKLKVRSYPQPYRGDWDWQPFGRAYATTDVVAENYTEGTLSVDIFDGVTQRPVWHGWATKRVLEEDRQNPSPAIREAVDAVIGRFPPQ